MVLRQSVTETSSVHVIVYVSSGIPAVPSVHVNEISPDAVESGTTLVGAPAGFVPTKAVSRPIHFAAYPNSPSTSMKHWTTSPSTAPANVNVSSTVEGNAAFSSSPEAVKPCPASG